jgi:hypothetical protein
MKSLTLEEITQIENIPINFVIGKERSGTTLLQVILNGHPNISAPPESRFIMLFYSRYGSIKNWTEKDLSNFCNDIFKEKAFKRDWNINKESLLASFITAREVATYSLLCKIIFYHFSFGKDIKHFFDKNPIYCNFLPQLKLLFPEAKYIHLVRDYRANIVSHRRVFMIKRGPDISYRWLKMNMEVENAKSHCPTCFLTIKYENLVSEPEKTVNQFCEFLSIPFYEEMISEHSKNVYPSYKQNNNKKFRSIHQKVFTPITASFVHEWKKVLPSDDISQAEKIAGEYAEKMYEYPKIFPAESNRINIFMKLIIQWRYQLIKNTYITVLNSPKLYVVITKYVWKNF